MAVEQIQQLETLAPNLPEIPERLVFSADQANTYCEGCIQAYQLTYRSIINMIEHFDGKYPRDPYELEKANLNWVSNVPYRKAQAKIDAVVTNRLNMYLSSIYFCNINMKPKTKEVEEKPEYFFLANPLLADVYAQKLAKILIETLMRDARFLDEFLKRMTENQVKWGYAASVNREFDVLPEVLHNLDFGFEKATRRQNIKMFIEFFEQRASDLYRLYKEQSEIGWKFSNYDKLALEEVLKDAFEKAKNASYNSWDMIVRSFDTELVGTFSNSPQIQWARIYNEELSDGSLTVTLYKFNRDATFTGRRNTLMNGGNNFRGTRLAYQKNFSDIKFTDEFHFYPDTGYTNTDVIQDMRGLGIFALEEGIQYDIMRNAMNDLQFVTNTLKFQPEFTQQASAFELGQFGPFMMFPTGFPVLQLNQAAMPPISESIGFLQYQDAEFTRLTQSYNPQISDRLRDRATNQQVLQVSQEVSDIKQEGAIIQLAALQHALKMILVRMKKDLKVGDPGYDTLQYFKTRVYNELCPKRDYPNTDEGKKAKRKFEKEFYTALIDSVDTVVLDYVTNDVTKLEMMLRISGDNPYAQRYYKRRMAYALGRPYVELEQFFPLDADPSKNFPDTSLAFLENNAFWTTGEIPFNGLQNHTVHLETHLLKAVEVLKSVLAGRDIQEVNHWLTNMLPNAQQHLQAISADPYQEERAKEFAGLFDNIITQSKIVDAKAREAAQQMAQQAMEGQQQQGQSALDPVVQQKLMTLQVQADAKMARTEQQNQFRQEQMVQQQQFKQMLAREDHNFKLSQEAETQALKRYGS